ncbi:TlpA family protein disulfide reductase [Pedobacter frigidisoli]|uniref:TlpA family protein disulfide reductase n=1 Tax=Pedobacter frigidisoli TaxID=2530455 RepID=A0A4R0P7X3_9SPHI|nr:TlpA disulfide reductase family protein [Pedobacter frigidisoli]TCD11608.1 TlpA family protein disulfide reductase [Pedobacter frigidisoli]
MKILIIAASFTLLFSGVVSGHNMKADLPVSEQRENPAVDSLKRKILKAWNSELFWKGGISLDNFENEVLNCREKAAVLVKQQPLKAVENKVFADFAELSARRDFVRNQKDRSAVPQSFYNLLDVLSINDPLFQNKQTSEFSNFFNAYVAMLNYRSGKEEPTMYDQSRYAMNHLTDEELKSNYVGMNISSRNTRYMMDSEMIDLIREVNRLSKDDAFKKKVNEWEALYSPIMAGKPMPDFELPNQYGKKVKFSDFKGKAVIIDVWATWCSVCIKEMPYFDAFKKEMKDRKDVVLLSIGWEQTDDKPEWKKFVKDHKLEGIQLLSVRTKNEKDNLEQKLVLHSMPRYIFIDKQGKFVDSYGPYPSNPDFKEMLLKTIAN